MSVPRLLVICHGFPPYHGGAELASGYLAAEAVRDGFDVEILTSDLGGRLPSVERTGGMTVHRVRSPKKAWVRHTTPELAAFYLAGRRWLDARDPAWRPDFTLAHFTVPAGLLARRLRRGRGVPYAVVLHGSDVPGYQPARFGAIYPLLKPVARRVWREAAGVIAVSAPLRDLARRTWPEGDPAVVANGVDLERFRPAPGPAAGAGPLRLLAVAQWIERKGLRYLIKALGGGDRLTLCGSGPQEAALRSLAAECGLADRVRFAGAVEHERLPDLLRGADLFVLPSLQEGLPLALLEAMASGLAVVATPVGGIPDVLQDGRNALLVPPADAPAIRAAIDRMRDPVLRARLGGAAREAALGFGWPAVWRRYREILEPVLRAPDAARGRDPDAELK